MIFPKNKKLEQQEAQKQLELQKIEEEKLRLEEQKRIEEEQKQKEQEEAVKNTTPYKFSAPNPMPKDLVAVLKDMFKRLFPDVLKAYLVSAQYEEKKGYLLVVDIDAKFLRIINLYLDGETKKVRDDIPIACVLYSRSGNLTDGMAPFYRKEGTEPATILSLSDFTVKETDTGFLFEELFEKQENLQGTNEESAEEYDEADSTPTEDDNDTVKVKPETKEQLFALMTRLGKDNSEENLDISKSAFGEFEFYIPYASDLADGSYSDEVLSQIPEDIKQIYLVNRENGIKAMAFFTDEENALAFSKEHGTGVLKLSYNSYKTAVSEEIIPPPSAEGIIINPDLEQILLPPDYPLL